MAVLPYLIRVLGIEGYGLVAYSQAFTLYFTILTDYGFNLSGTRFIAQHRDKPDDIRRQFWRIMVLKLAFAAAGLGVLIALTLTVPQFKRYTSYFLWSYLSVLGTILMPQWYFQGLEQMRQISILTGSAKIASAALLFLCVHRPQDAILAVILQSSGLLAAGIMGFVVALRGIGFEFVRPSRRELRTALVDGWHLFISMAAISLYTNTNLVLVGLIAGNVQAGYFSAAEKLIRAMAGLISPATQVFFPHIAQLITRSRESAMEAIRRLFRWMGGFTLLISVSILFTANHLATLMVGRGAAAGCVAVIHWIAFLPFLTAISNVLGVQTMIPFGFDRQFSYILIGSGCLNLLLGVPLIHLWGASGAGMSVLVTETCVTLVMLLFLQQKRFTFFHWERIR